MESVRILGIFLTIAMIASITTVIAVDTEVISVDPIEEETQHQIKAMNNGLGAEIRLLQLEHSIEVRIAIGNHVIEKLQELEVNTTELESIIYELEMVKMEVQEADPNAEDAVQQFVDLKSDAIELTQKFRETVKEVADEETLTQLREEARIMKQERHEEAVEIKQKIRQHNKEKMDKIKAQHGLEINEVIEKLGNGEITTEQAKEQIKQKLNEMTPKQRFGNYTTIKEDALRNQIQARQKFEEVKKDFALRERVRMERRLNISIEMNAELGELIQERIQQRIDQPSLEPFQGYGGNAA